MRKYLAFVAVSLFTVIIIAGVGSWQGMDSLIFAWTLNLMLMMMVMSFTETFNPALNSAYYHRKPWEREGKLYERLGINAFRKLLVWVGWEKLNKAANPVNKRLDALIHLEYGTRKSEFGHSVIFFVVLAFTLFVGFRCGWMQSLWLLVLNVILNVYPVGLQRYNRPRLQRAIEMITIRHGGRQRS